MPAGKLTLAIAATKKPSSRKVKGKASKITLAAGPSMNAMIKKVVNRMAESKISTFRVVNQSLYNYSNAANFSTNNLFVLSPYSVRNQIAQGTNQSTRVGNKITISKGLLKIAMVLAPYDATTNPVVTPIEVICYIFKLRQDGLIADVTNSLATDFLQSGDTDLPLTGNISDMIDVVNSDQIKLLKTYRFKLGFSSAEGTGLQAGQQHFANNDFHFNIIKTINTTKFLTKEVIFNDTTAIPLSEKTYMIFNIIDADGTAMASTTVPCYLSLSNTLYYKDM